MSELKIESGIPVPKLNTAGNAKRSEVGLLMEKMGVGDMIRLPFEGKITYQQSRLGALAKRIDKGEGRKFITRKIDDKTIGLWRTK